MINFRYSKLTLAGKILLPMLSVFLGIWFLGAFLAGCFATRRQIEELNRETQMSATQIANELNSIQATLTLKAKSITDVPQLATDILEKDKTALLQTLLPIRSNLNLDLLEIVDEQGKTLSKLTSPAVQANHIQDSKIKQLIQKALYISSFVTTQDAGPLLVKTISIKSRQDTVGSLIIGYALTNEALEDILGTRRQQIVLLSENDVIATTFSADSTAELKNQLDRLPTESTSPLTASLPSELLARNARLRIKRQDYLRENITLPGIPDSGFQAVVLTPLSDFQRSQRQLWILVSGLGVIGGLLISISGLYVTRCITHRITYLTEATKQVASGDLETYITVVGNDEVATLADSFNHMSEQLKKRNLKIKTQVAELERLVVQLQQMPEQVHAQKMSGLSQMVAGVAHEINNPIGFIYSNLEPAQLYIQDLLGLIRLYQKHYPTPAEEIQVQEEALEIDFLEQDVRKLLGSMESGAQRIREIVLSLRNFARKDEAVLKEVNLHNGIDSTLIILAHRLQAQPHRVAIQVIKEYGCLPNVLCFAGEINQVITSLLNNAIEAIERGLENDFDNDSDNNLESDVVSNLERDSGNNSASKPCASASKPTIHICTQLECNDRITIQIRDNGPGIPAEIQSKLFDPFFTTKPVGEGIGIGLSIVYQIVAIKHGGKIWCESQLGSGTTFFVQLPIKQSDNS